jgi:hypothetical protein
MTDIVIPVCIALVAGVFLTWVGIRAPEENKRRVIGSLLMAALALAVLTAWSVVRSQKTDQRRDAERRALPEKVAEYIRNTAPPIAIERTAILERPAPPTGLIVAVDGNWGLSAVEMSRNLTDFLQGRGQAPHRQQGETDIDYITRANSWYEDVIHRYERDFEPQVANLFTQLAQHEKVDERVSELAKNPVNPLGIKILASQLEILGNQYPRP